MTAVIIAFPRIPERAVVIIPAGEPSEDRCRAVSGGWPIDAEIHGAVGPFYLVRRQILEHRLRNGLPVTIHPECYRRAGWPRLVGI